MDEDDRVIAGKVNNVKIELTLRSLIIALLVELVLDKRRMCNLNEKRKRGAWKI